MYWELDKYATSPAMCQWHLEVSFQKHICWPLTPSLLVLNKGSFWNDGHKEAKVAQLGFLLIKWDGSRLKMKETISMEEDGKSLLMEHWMRTIPSHAPGEIKQVDQAGTETPEGWKCSSWSNAAGVRQPGCEFQPYYLPGADYLPCCCSVAKLCLTLCSPMDCSTPDFPIHHHLPPPGVCSNSWLSQWYSGRNAAPISSSLEWRCKLLYLKCFIRITWV